MGFGLHTGWAIEGAIGSHFKIDASYLSPNINLAARLEVATLQYGVHMLISGELIDVMNKDIRKMCREIDTVTVKGSVNPMRLFTIDLNESKIVEAHDRLIKLTNKDKKKILEREKFVVWQALKNRSMSTLSLFKNDADFIDLRSDFSKEFQKQFAEGYQNYKKGMWKDAKTIFEKCVKQRNDGPSKTLLEFMEETNFVAPSDWDGYRALTSK